MTSLNDDVFVVPVNDDFLVYSPLNGISAFVNQSAVSELQKQLHLRVNVPNDRESNLFELVQAVSQEPLQRPKAKTGRLDPEFLGIIPTRSCNGACNYCDFGADRAPTEKMSYKLAADVIDWYAELIKSKNKNILEIHFFGGEPLVAFDVIEVVVHKARTVALEKDLIPYLEISTNGQCSDNDADILSNYFNKVILSLDGFKEIHDIHRPLRGGKSSFNKAVETAKIISNSHADLCVRCCVSNQNISRMEEITHWLCEDFALAAINFEILCPSTLTESKGLYPPDPVDFSVKFQKSREIAKQYGIEVVYASDISEQLQVSSCPVGKDTVIVSPDGRISNCYLLPNRWEEVGLCLDFGFFHSRDNVDIDLIQLEEVRKMVVNKPRCDSCFCQYTCAGGCHVGNTYPGCELNYDAFCRQTRLISVFTLLSKLDLTEQIEKLLNCPPALNRIADRTSDNLKSFVSQS